MAIVLIRAQGPTGLLKKELCRHFSLSPRDLRLLDGRAPMTFSPTVLVRENSVCYASSVLRAVITPQAIHIISATFDRHYQEDDSRLSAEEICQSLKTTMGLGLRELLASSNHSPQQCDEVLPFELRALEAILYRITSGCTYLCHLFESAYVESVNSRKPFRCQSLPTPARRDYRHLRIAQSQGIARQCITRRYPHCCRC